MRRFASCDPIHRRARKPRTRGDNVIEFYRECKRFAAKQATTMAFAGKIRHWRLVLATVAASQSHGPDAA